MFCLPIQNKKLICFIVPLCLFYSSALLPHEGADIVLGVVGGTLIGTLHPPLVVGGATLFVAPLLNAMVKKLYAPIKDPKQKLADELKESFILNLYGALYGLALGGFASTSTTHTATAKKIAWTSLLLVSSINGLIILGTFAFVSLLKRIAETLLKARHNRNTLFIAHCAQRSQITE